MAEGGGAWPGKRGDTHVLEIPAGGTLRGQSVDVDACSAEEAGDKRSLWALVVVAPKTRARIGRNRVGAESDVLGTRTRQNQDLKVMRQNTTTLNRRDGSVGNQKRPA